MRICFVNDYFLKDPSATITGPMVQTYLIATGLARRGWQVEFVATTQSDCAGITENHQGVSVHYVGVPARLLEFSQSKAIARKLRTIRADVFYYRGRSPVAGMTAQAAATQEAKFVWASSGDPGCKRGKYVLQQLPKKRGLRRLIYRPLFRWADRVYERAIETADLVLVQNNSQFEDLKREFRRDAVLLKSGLPVPPDAVKLKPAPPVVLWISAVKPDKQPQFFLELVERCVELKAKFVLVGKVNDPVWQAKLGEAVHRFPSFSYRGEIPFERVSDVFAEASLLVNTSVFEGMPNSFIQAWLHGVPVLSLNVDPDEIMAREGIGVRTGSRESLVEHTKELITNASKRESMGRKARAVAEREFGLESFLDRFEELIRPMVQTSNQ